MYYAQLPNKNPKVLRDLFHKAYVARQLHLTAAVTTMKNKCKDQAFNTMAFTQNDTSAMANVPSVSHIDTVNVAQKIVVFCSFPKENMIIHSLIGIYSTIEHQSVWQG